MSSPVLQTISNFILIDRNNAIPIYLQIANQFSNLIQRGILPLDLKLPGTRKFAEVLGIHRKTVIAAFTELEIQGWLSIRPNIGTFTIQPEKIKKIKINSVDFKSIESFPNKTGFNFEKSNILELPTEKLFNNQIFINDGTPDDRLNAISKISKKYSSILKRKSFLYQLQNHEETANTNFTLQLSNYLNITRGLRIQQKNIVITRNSEMSLYIISRIILKPNDIVLVGELSYYKANMIFQTAGAKLKTVSVDSFGLCVDEIKSLSKKYNIRAIYLSPQHHYPTTSILCPSRRIALLNLATDLGIIILEDDSNFDLQYENANLLPLANANNNGMVIYSGIFGSFLIPNLQAGFIVAPENLILEAKKYLKIIDPVGDKIKEQVLCELIYEGDFVKYLNRDLQIYKSRRNFVIEYLRTNLSQFITFIVPKTGLAVYIEFLVYINFKKLIDFFKQQNIIISKHCIFKNKKITGFRLGFGNLNTNELHIVLNNLKMFFVNNKM